MVNGNELINKKHAKFYPGKLWTIPEEGAEGYIEETSGGVLSTRHHNGEEISMGNICWIVTLTFFL